MKASSRKTASAFSEEFGADNHSNDEHRNKTRLCTVFLFAAAATESDEGLCRVKNISDQGMMVVTGLDVNVGEQIAVTLSDAITLSAEIIWVDAGHVGLHFSDPIDSASVLEALGEKGSRTHRPPRLVIGLVGTAATPDGIQPIRALDISRNGMKIAYSGTLEPGTRIKVVLENGLEQRGVVKWSMNQVAGLRFLHPIAQEMVASVAELNGVGRIAGQDASVTGQDSYLPRRRTSATENTARL